MKKFLLSILYVGLTAMALTACKDDPEMTDSRPTYYPVLTVIGDEFQQVPIGSAFKDNGCSATLNGEDYSSHVVAVGADAVDTNTAGLYSITYYATNPDGYTVSTSRTVAVCDPTITTDISGTYVGIAGTQRITSAAVTPYDGYKVTFTKAAPGIFAVSDWLGGYYDQRAGYGAKYAMKGYAQLLADGTINILSGDVAGWGDSYDDFGNASYDEATGIISWQVVYAGMLFQVVLN